MFINIPALWKFVINGELNSPDINMGRSVIWFFIETS
jgi:hypothetical protein